MYIEIEDKPTNSEEMPANTFGQLTACIATRGYNPSEIIGSSASGRSRLEVIEQLQEFLNDNV